MPETTVIYIDDTGAPAVAIIARRAAEQAVVNAEAAAARAEAALGGVIPTLTAPEIAVEGSATVDGPVDGAYSITLVRPQATGTPDPLILLASLTVDGSSALSLLDDLLGFTVPGGAEDLTIEAEWIVYNGVDPQVTSTVTVTLPALVVLTAPAKMAAPTVAADGFDVVRVTRAMAPDDGGSPITGYDMQWSLDEQNWTLVEGFASPYDIAGLADVAGTVYAQTRAVNGVDPGEWSDSGSAVTAIEQPTIVAPTATGSLDDLTLTEGGDAVTADAGALVNDGGGTLAFTLPTARTGVSIDGATGIVTINPSTTGLLAAASVIVRATNEAGSVDLGFSLTVEEAAPVITAPTAAGALADQTFTQGTGVQTLDASGDFSNGGGTLAFSLPTKPAGVTINSATGVISFDTATTAVVSGASVVVRATNSAGSADSGFSLTINAAFAEVAGRISTGTAQLSIGPVTGTDPAGMAFVGYFTAPAAGFGTSTVPWFTSADGTHQAYVSITAAGEAFASIYTRVGGTLQAAQTIYFQGDPIQPGERFVLVGSGIAGGSFALRQSRAGADFVDAGSVTIPAGAVFPIYGQEHTFFGAPIISDGVFVFAYGALPGVLGSLAALNAGKASIVAAGGARPTIDTIKAALGTPVYAVYGPAATITANRGTAGGTYTKTGTITDYVPAVYQSDIVLSASGYVSGGGGGTNERTATMAMLLFVAYPDDPISLNSTFSIKSAGGDGSSSIQIISDGNTQVVVRGQDAVGGPISPASNAVASGLDTDPVLPGEKQAFLLRAGNGKVLVDRARDGGDFAPMMDINIPVDATFNVGGSTWQFGENTGSGNKRQEISGAFVFGGPSLPTATLAEIKAAIMASDGTMTDDVASIEAMFGPARVAAYGPAADWNARLNKGTGTDFTTKGGTFTDVARPVEDAIPANAELLSRLSIQPHRDTTALMEGEVIRWGVDGLTEDEWKRVAVYWNFDDDDDDWWNTELANAPGLMSNKIMRRFPMGPTIAYGYRRGGTTRTIRANIVFPAWEGVESCQLTFEQPVMSLSDRYNAGNTWVVVPSGGTDPTEIAGTRVTTFQAAHAAGRATTTGEALIYIPGGYEELLTATSLGGYPKQGHLYIAGYGTGRPRLDCSQQGLGFNFAGSPETVVIRKVEMDGGWDPDTAAGAGVYPFSVSYGRSHYSFTDCRIQNARCGINFTHSVTSEIEYENYSVMLMDTQFYNCLDYGLYVQDIDELGMTGCTAFWEPDMPMTKDAKDINGTGDYAIHGIARISRVKNAAFHTVAGGIHHGWSQAGYVNPTLEAESSGGSPQPLIRVGSLGVKADSRIFIGQSYADGMLISFDAGADGGLEGPSCILHHGCYSMAGAETYGLLFIGHSGLSVQSSFFNYPNVPRELTNTPLAIRVGNSSDLDDAPGLASKNFAFSRNGIIYMLDGTNVPSVTLGQLTGENMAQNLSTPVPVITDGQMVYAPNRTLSGHTPPSVTERKWGPQPRKIGQFVELSDGSIFSDLQYATPPDSAIIVEPSGLATAATSAYTHAADFWGRLRPAASPSIGPIEENPQEGVFGPWVEPDTTASVEAVV